MDWGSEAFLDGFERELAADLVVLGNVSGGSEGSWRGGGICSASSEFGDVANRSGSRSISTISVGLLMEEKQSCRISENGCQGVFGK